MGVEESRPAWIAAAALIAGFLGALWIVGALSAAIFGGGWTTLPLAELPATALRLPSNLGDPAAAWPRPYRFSLPGPAGFYVTTAMLMAAGGGASWAGRRAFLEAGEILARLARTGTGPAPSARWAGRRELRALRVPGPQPGRLTLGRFGRSLIAAEPEQSVIAFAPTRGFKTTGLAIPALLEWDGPVLATSIRSDLLRDTIAHRDKKGRVMVFDPARVTGFATTRATPLWGAGTWRGAMRVAHWLASGGFIANSMGSPDAEFWTKAAEKLLAPLLFAAANGPHTMGSIVRWLEEGDDAIDEVEEVLDKTGTTKEKRRVAEEAKRAYRATLNREERQRSSVYTTAETILAAFSDPHVVAETEAADYSPAALLDGKANTLYLCAPRDEQARLQTVFSMIVQELLAVVSEAVAATGKPLDPPLLLLLDEAANIAPLPNLDEIASTAAGDGVQLLSIYQDLAQMIARHGERAATSVNNHKAVLFGSGIKDPATGRLAADLIGSSGFRDSVRTKMSGGNDSTSESTQYRDLLPPDVLRQIELGTAVLIYGHLPPAKVTLRPWFRDAELTRLRESSPSVSQSEVDGER